LGDKLNKITTVDISQDMLTLAKHYFGFQQSDKLESIHGDAHQFVMDSNLTGHYDIILCDVNCHSEDQSISPPWNFLSKEYLEKLSSLLADTGYLAMNVLYYSNETKEKVFDAFNTHLKNKFDKLNYLEIEDWTNRVFVMSRDAKLKDDKWSQMAGVQELINFGQVLENMLKNWNVQNRKNWIEEMEMEEHIANFKQISGKK